MSEIMSAINYWRNKFVCFMWEQALSLEMAWIAFELLRRRSELVIQVGMATLAVQSANHEQNHLVNLGSWKYSILLSLKRVSKSNNFMNLNGKVSDENYTIYGISFTLTCSWTSRVNAIFQSRDRCTHTNIDWYCRMCHRISTIYSSHIVRCWSRLTWQGVHGP